jgi:maltose O-acetyltransferase
MNLKHFFFIKLRIVKYKWLSDCHKVVGQARLFHPLLVKGKGTVIFGKNVQVGVIASPNFYSHYAYVEARTENSQIIFGDNVTLNNGFSAEAMNKITIKSNVLIGVNCSIMDHDGHNLAIDQRIDGKPNSAQVLIEENVFIGDNVTLLKGVTVGKNSIIGNGAVVTKSIPANVIAAGNPAQVIREI